MFNVLIIVYCSLFYLIKYLQVSRKTTGLKKHIYFSYKEPYFKLTFTLFLLNTNFNTFLKLKIAVFLYKSKVDKLYYGNLKQCCLQGLVPEGRPRLLRKKAFYSYSKTYHFPV